MSLDYLLYVQAHYYSNPDVRPQPEYEPAEVDQLIWDKQQRKHEEENKHVDNRYCKKMFVEGKLQCTCCHLYKPFDEFHRAKDKKTGHRSHCKECRKIPF